MSASPVELARIIRDLQRRLEKLERANSLNKSTVAIPVEEGVNVNLDVPGSIFTGVEASVDAGNALTLANAASKTFRQDTPPDPVEVGVIPEGALWYDTDAENRGYRWESGSWVAIPVGQRALDPDLVALITMRFATEAARDAALPAPDEGMQAYVVATNLEYQYSNGVWVPLIQYIKKLSNQSVNGTTLVLDNDFQVQMVPGTYRVEAFLHMSGANTGGDLAMLWQYTGVVVSGNRVARGMAAAETSGVRALGRWTGHFLSTLVTYGTERDDTTAVHEDILLRVSTSGVLQLQWAQKQYDDYPTTLSAASRLYITKMN